MRQCVEQKPLERKSEVQQIRSLSLSVKDYKISKVPYNVTQFYCLVFIDGMCVARTRPMEDDHGQRCYFDEHYRFKYVTGVCVRARVFVYVFVCTCVCLLCWSLLSCVGMLFTLEQLAFGLIVS